METLWFILITFMLAMYVVLDGFDIGAGIIHLLVARTDPERRSVLGAIGPVWDGNEVWLVATGGTLYFAFPFLYASSFSGFYLPLMIVLWLLMLRGAGIELRHQLDHPLWSSLWDAVFSVSSILLAIFFGAALGNVVRGVPLNEQGYFFEPLWTTFTVEPDSGILDWFTVLLGLVALATLAAHGAHYVAIKTSGEVQRRSRSIAATAWWGVLATSVLALAAVSSIRPELWDNFALHPWMYCFPAGGLLGIAGMRIYCAQGNDRSAFLASGLFIVSMLSATAAGLYPALLPASTGAARAITIGTAAAGAYGLRVGLAWWIVGMALVSVYGAFVYRSFRGKVSP
jgi:cytochrome d ubiquinol oxidase subunit II